MQTFPFLSMIEDTKHGTSCFALINIVSKEAISFYELTKLSLDEYDTFMALSKNWWNKCPIIPISVYYHNEFKVFEHTKRLLYHGDYKIVGGFNGASLSNLCEKRIKRKIVTIQ